MRAPRRPVAPALPRLRPMTIGHVEDVLAIEQRAYAFPWTRGNFIDSLAAGYWMQLLRGDAGELLGYVVAQPGVDEMHLLNVTVEPRRRREGHASTLMRALVAEARRRKAVTLWLEVRPSNVEALALYARFGFEVRGQRKGYYPAARGQREDALVHARDLASVLPSDQPPPEGDGPSTHAQGPCASRTDTVTAAHTDDATH